MSPYLYRCGQCRSSSPPTPTRAESEAYRRRHRVTAHGGLVPDGERIDRTTGRAARDPDTRYVSTRALLLGLALLALVSLIARALGH